MNKGITILGLGPGDPQHLTRQAWEWLNSIGEITLRTRQHPTVAGFPPALKVNSFDSVYEAGETFEAVYDQIVEKVIELGQKPEGITYAVPGHPYVAEVTCPEIVRRARKLGIPVQVIEGLSFLEPVCAALEVDPFSGMVLVDAIEVSNRYTLPFPPDIPVLVAQIYSREMASNLKLTLTGVYPDEHPVRLVHGAGTAGQVVEDLKLYEIDRSPQVGLLTALYIPPMEEGSSFESFQEVVARLRAPDGCPWDQEQTHRSLRQHLLEETYEALAALDADEPQEMAEEFGDLLLQIFLHAQIGDEAGEFTLHDVVKGIRDKIVRRHPHVFANLEVKDVDGVLTNWEKLKAKERKQNGVDDVKGLLDGVPAVLPALNQAQEYQARVGRVGFDWHDISGVYEKVTEELDEVRQAKDDRERTEEVGDLFFSVVNLARWFKVDAESALRQTNQKFKKRFKYVENRARESGRSLSDMTLEEMDVYWDEAKGLE